MKIFSWRRCRVGLTDQAKYYCRNMCVYIFTQKIMLGKINVFKRFCVNSMIMRMWMYFIILQALILNNDFVLITCSGRIHGAYDADRTF